ncbi:MAG: hypothetical protein IKL43_03630, partial [Alistipes sp.]|nr:hypothetical protein [Alistipes sp.]
CKVRNFYRDKQAQNPAQGISTASEPTTSRAPINTPLKNSVTTKTDKTITTLRSFATLKMTLSNN